MKNWLCKLGCRLLEFFLQNGDVLFWWRFDLLRCEAGLRDRLVLKIRFFQCG